MSDLTDSTLRVFRDNIQNGIASHPNGSGGVSGWPSSYDELAMIEELLERRTRIAPALDPRDVPKPQTRPCKNCGEDHYFELDLDDADTCVHCGRELYPISRAVERRTNASIIVRNNDGAFEPFAVSIDDAIKDLGRAVGLETLKRAVERIQKARKPG